MTTEPMPDGTIYRPPTSAEASAYWKIPARTIRTWWEKKDEIVESKSRSRALPRHGWICQWPEMEKELFDTFCARRSAGQLVQRSWFRRTSRELFKRHYPDCEQLFVFSNGWFGGFTRRCGIARRMVTKQASKLPEEYIDVTNSFLRFIRRNSQPHGPASLREVLKPNRFDLSAILNLDETPIPFEYLDGHTYDFRGARTVSGKSDRSGWDKRQATLILYIYADGIQRIKPKLIFHGVAGPTGRIYQQEGHRYSNEVTVAYNATAYNNEELFEEWITEELSPLLGDNRADNLLVMDVASFHKTPAILQKLRDLHVTTTLIPGGCTSLLQPLDTAVNKPFKGWLREATENYLDDLPDGQFTKWTVSDRRVMTTHVVAEAARKLADEKADLVRKAFLECGISVHPDGSQDHLIRIKDISNSVIDFAGWETQEDPVIGQEDDFAELPEANDTFDEFLLEEEEFLPRNNYRTLLVKELKDLCRQRGLAVSGAKKVLIERLEQLDAQGSQ